MKNQSLGIAILLIIATFASQSLFASSFEETFSKKIDFLPGGSVHLQNTNGSIEVEGWDKDMVMIEATKKVKASSQKRADQLMEEVNIDISQTEKEIVIETRLPHQTNGGLFDWLFGDGVSVSVSYKMYVPYKSDLVLKSTNGSVNATSVSGQIVLKTTNGKIGAENIMGDIDAHTTNGGISAELDSMSPDHEMQFFTTNGSISVYLPSDAKCNVQAQTTNGSISTDFPLQVKGKFNSKSISGSVNGGGPLVEFHTTNGSIRIHEKNQAASMR